MRIDFSMSRGVYCFLFFAFVAMLSLSAFLVFPSVPSIHAASAERGALLGPQAPAEEREERAARAAVLQGRFFNPHAPQSLRWSLFNATASFLGIPGLVSPVDGLRDEGLGFHADGSTRRVGGSDASRDFSGQRAASYALSALGNDRLPWLYDSYAGLERDREGRAWDMGSEHSGLRAKNAAMGGGLGGGLGSGYGGTRGIFDSVLMRGLSSGMGYVNTALESAVLGFLSGGSGKKSPYGSGKARFNFMLDADGRNPVRLQGEGDILWPLYDSPYTTVYTQFGARSMYGSSGDSSSNQLRWIGNIGVGQRWYPSASLDEDGKVDSGNWMVGYNAFYDHDFTRGHQRGGVGVEAQYDWLKLSSNWYLPMSDWKNSQDFDGNYVRERAAQGWDVRVKGYLPFYREIALTGAYSQWYGEYVGLFGPSQLEKDPKVWSYGVEYTPVPALTAYVNQRQSERGNADTEFGLRFTYNFGMDGESQFKPARVAETRTVHGGRHDFVDRENKIILEYQTKNDINIEYLGYDTASFNFRIRDGFGKPLSGYSVRVTASGATLLAAAPAAEKGFFAQMPQWLNKVRDFLSLRTAYAFFSPRAAHANSGMNYTTDGSGLIRVRVDNVSKMTSLNLGVGSETRSYDRAALNLSPAKALELKAEKETLSDLTSVTLSLGNAAANAAVTWKVEGAGGAVSGGAKTDAAGKATATFTAKGTGTTTVTATVGGEKASVALKIIANQYTLTVNPTSLVMYTPVQAIFTVKRDGKAVAQDTAVTFEANANFKNLPSTGTADANGQIVVPNLVGMKAGAQTLNLTVDGQKASVSISVNAAAYTVEMSPATLTQYQSQNATFTVKRDGKAVTQGIGVSFATNTTNFTNLPSAPQKTNAKGQVVVSDFTALTQGGQTILLKVEDQWAGVPVNVAAAGYTVETSHATLFPYQPEDVTFTVKRGGKAVPSGTAVTFIADTTNFNNLPSGKQSTNASGQVVVSRLTGINEGSHPITLTAQNQKMQVQVTVAPADYTLESSHATLTQYKPANVVFTLKSGGRPVAQGTSVTFASNDDFKNLPTGPVTTGANGQIIVNNLVSETPKAQSIAVNVAGQANAASVGIKVVAVELTLEVSHSTLLQHKAESVTFTLKHNGVPIPQKVKLTFTANPAFMGLPTDKQTTSDSGQLVMDGLTALSAGAHTLTAHVDGHTKPVTASITVADPVYTLESSHASLLQYKEQDVTFTVKNRGQAVAAGTEVTFEANNALNLPSIKKLTDANGQVVLQKLVATEATDQTVKATVAGQKSPLSVVIAVTAAPLTLEISHTTLIQHKAEKVTFTLKHNGQPIPMEVGVTFVADTANFQNLPTVKQTTKNKGQIEVSNLTALTKGPRKISVKVDGYTPTVSVDLNVSPAAYTLTANPVTLQEKIPASVTFTLKRNTTEFVPAGTKVLFTTNSVFNLPSVEKTVGNNGQIVVDNLTGTKPGSQFIELTVDQEKVRTNMAVSSAVYALEAGTTELRQYKAQDVVFTVKNNNVSMPTTKVTFTQNPSLTLTGGQQTTDDQGNIKVRLTAIKAGAQTVEITVNGTKASLAFNVTAATYTLSASPAELVQHEPATVTFTVLGDGKAVPLGTEVVFSRNDNFVNLPTNTRTTDANGKIAVENLATRAANNQTIAVTVDGQALTVPLKVTAAKYELIPNPATLTQHKAQDVTFTVKRNGKQAAGGIPVSFVSNSQFNVSTEEQKTNTSGQITVKGLVTTAATAQTLSATVAGETVSVPFKVTAASYSIEANPTALVQHKPVRMVFTVKRDGKAVPQGVKVTFTTNGNFVNLPTSDVTNAQGQIIVKDLTTKAANAQSIAATVDGQAISVPFSVTTANYSIGLTPSTLKQFAPTKVVFTVQRNGKAVGAGVPVKFTSNANFQGLPDTEQTTTASGQITVSNLSISSATGQALAVTVAGQRVNALFTVTPVNYTLITNPGTLVQYQAETVRFAVKRDGLPVATGTTMTFESNTNFKNLPGSVTIGANGEFSVPNLTALAANSQTVFATVDGQRISTTFHVGSASFSLTPSISALTPNKAQNVTFTVQRNGAPALAGVPVSFASNTNFKNLPKAALNTDANGQVVVPDLMTTATTAQTLAVTVGGQSLSVPMTVLSSGYTLLADSYMLTKLPKDVIFTVQLEGAPVVNTPVTFTPNNIITDLPASATTDHKGQIVVKDLKGKFQGRHKVEITVAEQKASLNMTVSGTGYVPTVSPSPLNLHQSTDVTIKLGRLPYEGGIGVHITPNANFRNLPEYMRFDEQGDGLLQNITALTPGSETLEMQDSYSDLFYYVPINVAPASFTLTADPAVIDVNVKEFTVFTVSANGFPVRNTAVTLTPNPNFSNWPTTVTTDDNGQFIITWLTAHNVGQQTLQASVAGQNMSATINVNRPANSLSVSPEVLNMGTQTPVTFSLSPNGEAMKGMSASFTPSDKLTLPTTPQLINASGSFAAPVTARATGSHRVEISVDGQKYTGQFSVNSGGYAATTSTSTLTVNRLTGLTFKLTQNGTPVPNTRVSFSRNGAFEGLWGLLPGDGFRTDSKGEMSVTLTPISRGKHTLELNVNGQKTSVVFNVVSDAALTVTPIPNPLTMLLNTPMDVSFQIKKDDQYLGNAWVNFKPHPLFKNLPATLITDGSGVVVARYITATGAGAQTLEIEVDGAIHRVPLAVTVPAYRVTFEPVQGVGGSFADQQTATVTARVLKGGGPLGYETTVTWEVVRADNKSRTMNPGWLEKRSGLVWGNEHDGYDAEKELTSTTTSSYNAGSKAATIQLTDVLGTRRVTMKASVEIDGTVYSGLQQIDFGPGPLEKFGPPQYGLSWIDSVAHCGGTYELIDYDYQSSTNMPSSKQMQTIAGPRYGGNKGAAPAAGLGKMYIGHLVHALWMVWNAYVMDLSNGYDSYPIRMSKADPEYGVMCLRR